MKDITPAAIGPGNSVFHAKLIQKHTSHSGYVEAFGKRELCFLQSPFHVDVSDGEQNGESSGPATDGIHGVQTKSICSFQTKL